MTDSMQKAIDTNAKKCPKCGTLNLEIVYDPEHDDLTEICMNCGDDPRPGYDWCQRCGEDTWPLDLQQCEKCGFTD